MAVVHAQGTIQYTANLGGANEVTPNNSSAFGTGSLSLTGSTLAFVVSIHPGIGTTDAGFYGPASAGETNSQIFDLGTAHFVAPRDGFPGAVEYDGNFSLTSQQISDLQSGLWYVNIFTSAYPSGELRGQIQPVPEPMATVICLFGGALALAFRTLLYRRLNNR